MSLKVDTGQVVAVKKLIKFFGGQVNTASALNIEQSAVSNWVRGKNSISSLNAQKAERLTGGEIKASDLCPELLELEEY